MSTQPLALRLADYIDPPKILNGLYDPLRQAAAELRRLHEVNQELVEALNYSIKQVPELATVPGIDAALTKAGEK